jgi:hypothetical protein
MLRRAEVVHTGMEGTIIWSLAYVPVAWLARCCSCLVAVAKVQAHQQSRQAAAGAAAVCSQVPTYLLTWIKGLILATTEQGEWEMAGRVGGGKKGYNSAKMMLGCA